MLFDPVTQRQLLIGGCFVVQVYKFFQGIPLIFNGNKDNISFVIRWSLFDLIVLLLLIKFRIARLSLFVKKNFNAMLISITMLNSLLFSGYLGKDNTFPIFNTMNNSANISTISSQIIGSKNGLIKEIENELKGNKHLSFNFTPVCEASLTSSPISCVAKNTRPPNTQGLLDEQVILPNSASLILKTEGSSPFKVRLLRNNSFYAEYTINDAGEKNIAINKIGTYHIESIIDSLGDKGSVLTNPITFQNCKQVRLDGLFLSTKIQKFELERIISFPIWSLDYINDLTLPIEVVDYVSGNVHPFQARLESNNIINNEWIGYSLILDLSTLYPKKKFIIKLFCGDSFTLIFIPNLIFSLTKREFEIEGSNSVSIPFKILNTPSGGGVQSFIFEIESENNIKSLHKSDEELSLNLKGKYKINYILDEESLKHPQNISITLTNINPPTLYIDKGGVRILNDDDNDNMCKRETIMQIPISLKGNPPFRLHLLEDGIEKSLLIRDSGNDTFQWKVKNSPGMPKERKIIISSISDSKFLTPLPLLPSLEYTFYLKSNTHIDPLIVFLPFKISKRIFSLSSSKNTNNPSIIEFKAEGEFPLLLVFEIRDPHSNVIIKDEITISDNSVNSLDILKYLDHPQQQQPPPPPQEGSYKFIPLSIGDSKGCKKTLVNLAISLMITSQKPTFSFVKEQLSLGDEDLTLEVPIKYSGNGSNLWVKLLNLSTKEIIPFNLPLPQLVQSIKLSNEGLYRLISLRDDHHSTIGEDGDGDKEESSSNSLLIIRDEAPIFTFKDDGNINSLNVKKGKWIEFLMEKKKNDDGWEKIFNERIFILKDGITPIPLKTMTSPGTYRHSIRYSKVIQDSYILEIKKAFKAFLTDSSSSSSANKSSSRCPFIDDKVGPFYLGGLEGSDASSLSYSIGGHHQCYNSTLIPKGDIFEFWILGQNISKNDSFVVRGVFNEKNIMLWEGELEKDFNLYEEPWIIRKGEGFNSCIGDHVSFEVGGGTGPWKVSYCLSEGSSDILKGDIMVSGEKTGQFSLFLAKKGLLRFVNVKNVEGCHFVPKNLVEHVHQLPSAKILMKSGSDGDVWRGKKGDNAHFDIQFGGTGPFSVLYEKKNIDGRGNELFRLNGIVENVHRVNVESSGSFTIKHVSDRWCSFPPKL